MGTAPDQSTEASIPTDGFSLIVISAIALAAFWLVFSLVRKMFGLVLLAAIGIAAWVLWSNPELFERVMAMVQGRF